MGVDVGHVGVLYEAWTGEELQEFLYLEYPEVVRLLLVMLIIDLVHDLVPCSLRGFIFYLTINFGHLPIEDECEEFLSRLIIQEFIVFVCHELVDGREYPLPSLIPAHLVLRGDSRLEDIEDAGENEIEPEI